MSKYDELTMQELTDLLIHKVLLVANHEYLQSPESVNLLPSLKMEIREIQKEIIERGSD